MALLAGGNVAGAAITALSYPIISRIYDPAQFGAFAAAVAMLALVLTLTCLTYERAVPLPKDDQTAGDLVVVCLLATLAVSGLCAIVIVATGDHLLSLVDAEALSSYWWLLCIAQVMGGIVLAMTGWAVRFRDFRGMASSRVSQSGVTVLVQVAAGAAGAGTPGLLAGDALGRSTAGARLSVNALRRLREVTAGTSRARLARAVRRYRRFPLVGSWPSLINTVGIEAPVLLVAGVYGAGTGGLFAFAQRLVGSPISVLVLAISQVFVAEAADRVRVEAQDLVDLFRRTLRRLAIVSIPLMLALAVAAQVLVRYVFGDEWREAGTYIVILTPLYTMQLLSSPLGGILVVLERQDLWLIREVVGVALLGLAIVAAKAFGLGPFWAIVLMSAAGSLSYIFYGAISWHALMAHARGRPLQGEA